MESAGWFDKLLPWVQAIATIAVAVLLFLAHRTFHGAKNAVIESKEERLKSKEDQLRSKDEQIKLKDDQIRVMEKENDFLKLMTAEGLMKHYEAMKKLFEGQITQLETEKTDIERKLGEAREALRQSQVTEGAKSEQKAVWEKLIGDLNRSLDRTQIEIEAGRRYESKFQGMRLKDAYGPVGAWYLLFKSRAGHHGDGHEDNSGEADSLLWEKLKEVEAQAWEDFLDLTIDQALQWARTGVKKAPDKTNGNG